MSTINVTLTLKEAETLCIIATKCDPFGVFTGEIIRRINETAKKLIHEMTAEKEKEQ